MIAALLGRFPWAPWALAGVALTVAGVQTVRLSWEQAARATEHAKQAQAIQKLHERAEALSNELVIQQAIAMSRAAEKETIYVDRIKRIPVAPGEDDAARSERMRAGTAGVRDILCGRDPSAAFCGPAPR